VNRYRSFLPMLTVVFFLVIIAVAPIAQAQLTSVKISEIRIDQPSSDEDEYFELVGTANQDLTGLTYLVIGDGTGGSGVIEAVIDLSGQSIPSSTYFVAAESTFSLGTANYTTTLNFENSDNVTHLIVTGFTGSDGQDLDTDDDCTLDTTPWTSVVDSVSLIETAGSGDCYYGNKEIGPSGSYVPAHVWQCTEGWNIGKYDPDEGDDTVGAAATSCPDSNAVSFSQMKANQGKTLKDTGFLLLIFSVVFIGGYWLRRHQVHE